MKSCTRVHLCVLVKFFQAVRMLGGIGNYGCSLERLNDMGGHSFEILWLHQLMSFHRLMSPSNAGGVLPPDGQGGALDPIPESGIPKTMMDLVRKQLQGSTRMWFSTIAHPFKRKAQTAR